MGKPAATDRPCLPSLSHSFTLDFIVTAHARQVFAETIRPRITAFFADRGVRLSPAKTVMTPITDGFDFLGQTLRK